MAPHIPFSLFSFLSAVYFLFYIKLIHITAPAPLINGPEMFPLKQHNHRPYWQQLLRRQWRNFSSALARLLWSLLICAVEFPLRLLPVSPACRGWTVLVTCCARVWRQLQISQAPIRFWVYGWAFLLLVFLILLFALDSCLLINNIGKRQWIIGETGMPLWPGAKVLLMWHRGTWPLLCALSVLEPSLHEGRALKLRLLS